MKSRLQRPWTRGVSRLLPAALALGTLSIVACGGQHETRPAPGAPVAVRTLVVEATPGARVVEAVGSLHGAREAVLTAKVMGTVLEIRKHAGDAVVRGEVLVVLDDREVAGNIGQAQGGLAQAQAAAALAQANLQRFEQLFARGAASPLELDQARYAHETAQGAVLQAKAAVATAESYQSYTQIPAPFDGQVVDRLAEVGDLAAPGRALLRVEDARRLRAHVSLGETETGATRVGATVDVVVPALGGRVWTGTVAEMVPAVDPTTRTMLVKIDLPADPALRTGLFARARFAAGKRDALRVPRSAVVRRGGLTGVFVAESNRAAFRLVELGGPEGAETYEALSGIVAGDRIVLDPPATLTEGAPLEVSP